MVRNLLVCLLLGVAYCDVRAEGEASENTVEDAKQHNQPGLEQQKEELLGLLAQVDERYGDVAASLRTLEGQIKQSSASLDSLRKEIDSYHDQIDKLDLELADYVRAAYAMGQQDRLKLMLNQQDPALSSRMMVYYEYLNKSRLDKLANLKQTVNYLDQLDRDKQAESDLLEKSVVQKKAEQKVLAEVRKERDRLLARLNDDIYDEEDQLSLLQESENKLIGLIETLESESGQADSGQENNEPTVAMDPKGVDFPKTDAEFGSLKGKLPLPVKGKFASMEGNSPTESGLKGVLIAAKEGTEIRAVSHGKVAYAGMLKAYGLLTIVEHDNGYMTLYAFNQSQYKHKGDRVEAGEVIASVGQSGGRNQPGLYFEIRKNGKAIDPLQWCNN